MALAIAASACTAQVPSPTPTRSSAPPSSSAKEETNAVVRAVLDGRTIELENGATARIRSLAAPAACWADAALAFTRLTLQGKAVRVTSITPGEIDLVLEDGTDFASFAVQTGVLRTEGLDGGPLLEAETAAAQAKLGLWAEPCQSAAPVSTTTPPPPAPVTTTRPPDPPCAVAYQVGQQWPGGFQAKVTVRNTSAAAITGWTLRWTFGDGQAVTQMWDAVQSQSGAEVSAANAQYATTIPAGGSVSFGFNGSSRDVNSEPRSFTLNGSACSVE